MGPYYHWSQANYPPEENNHTPDQSSYAPDQTSFVPYQTNNMFDQTNFAPEQSNYAPDQSNFVSDQTNYMHDQTNFAHEQANYMHEQTNYAHEQANYTPDQTNYMHDQTNFAAEQTTYMPEQPSYASNSVVANGADNETFHDNMDGVGGMHSVVGVQGMDDMDGAHGVDDVDNGGGADSADDVQGVDDGDDDVDADANTIHYDPIGPPGTGVACTGDVAVVTTAPNCVDLFYIAKDGQVIGYSWRDKWSHFSIAPAKSAVAGGIAAISREAPFIEVWWICPAGSVQGRSLVDGKWVKYTLSAEGKAAPGSKICAISKHPEHIEVFWISPTGSVEASYWIKGCKAWLRHQLARSGSAFAGEIREKETLSSGLAAISPEPTSMEVYWVGPSGSIESAWTYGGPWKRYTLADGGSAVIGADISALTQASKMQHLWWISLDGSLNGRYKIAGPNPKWEKYDMKALNIEASWRSGLFSFHATPTTVELVWISADGMLQHAYWHDVATMGSFSNTTITPAAWHSGICGISGMSGSMKAWYVNQAGEVQNLVRQETKT